MELTGAIRQLTRRLMYVSLTATRTVFPLSQREPTRGACEKSSREDYPGLLTTARLTHDSDAKGKGLRSSFNSSSGYGISPQFIPLEPLHPAASNGLHNLCCASHVPVITRFKSLSHGLL
jgi:hypothetical protein